MKYAFDVNEFASGETYKPGDRVLVALFEDFANRGEWYDAIKEYADTGYPGNLDPNIRRFHGWRGTTNNIAVTACGVYVIKDVKRLDDYGRVRIVLHRKDIRKEEP